MLGTIINSSAIIIGGILGLILKSRFTKKYQEIVSQATGISVLFLGISTALNQMFKPDVNSVLFIFSLVIGGLIGQLIDIEERLKLLGDFIEKRFSNEENTISKSFVSSSLLFCVGSMAILGSIESGISNNHTTLITKSILDGTCSIVFASTMGYGVLFSAVAVFIYQGTITLLAGIIQPYITEDILRELTLVGGILITGIGINLLEIKKLKVGNLLPSLFIPVIYYIIFK